MKPHTRVLALLAIAALICLVGGAGALQEGTTTATTVTTSPTTPATAGGNATTDLTNEGGPQAAMFENNISVTTFGSVPGLTPEVSLDLLAENVAVSPMVIAWPNDDTGRIFVVDQIGVVKIVNADGTVVDQPFLDLRDKLVNLSPTYDERGLLAIAFHPEYQTNGKIYAFYSAPLRDGAPVGWSCTNHLSEFTVSQDNPNAVNVSSEKILMYIDKPYQNHNGGQMAFSPADGYLYIPLGDGGRADDVGNGHTPVIGNAQDLTKIYGKLLRIDVSGGTQATGTSTIGTMAQMQNQTQAQNQTHLNQTGGTAVNETENPSQPTWTTAEGTLYTVPPDNPYAQNQPQILDSYAYSSVPVEIYAYGFRNPAYMSFDSGGSNLPYIAMAGQNLFESVFVVTKGGNYGWNIREGTHCFDVNRTTQPGATCNTTGYQGESLIGPIVEGGHDIGNTVVGGQVYRGTALPNFTGSYVFGYWSDQSRIVGNGTLLVATPPSGWDESMLPDSAASLTTEDNAMWTLQQLRIVGNPNERVNEFVRSIGEGPDGELYLLTNAIGGPDPANTTGKIWKIVAPTNATAEGTATATTTLGAAASATTVMTAAATTTSGAANTASPATTPTSILSVLGLAIGVGATPSSSPSNPSGQTLWDVLQATEVDIPYEETLAYGNFTIFTELLLSTGVDRILTASGPYTVFAPTDGAFENLPSDVQSALFENDAVQTGQTSAINRTAVALGHIVQGSYTAGDIGNVTNVTTLAGSSLPVTVDGSHVSVENATIVIPDIPASNGILHGIDEVLLPFP